MAQTYVTREGDTLWSIASHFYGDGNRWQELYNANQAVIGADANVLFAGKTLTIPDAAGSGNPSSGQAYTTTDTDTLWDIAVRFYGDGNRWPEIYKVNQAAIGANPNVIHGGIQLTIPNSSGGSRRTYTTVGGDTLSSIAAHFYGDANRWQEIYNANQAAIGANPNMIQAGIQLNIP